LNSVNTAIAKNYDTKGKVAELAACLPKVNRNSDEAAAALGGGSLESAISDKKAERRKRQQKSAGVSE